MKPLGYYITAGLVSTALIIASAQTGSAPQAPAQPPPQTPTRPQQPAGQTTAPAPAGRGQQPAMPPLPAPSKDTPAVSVPAPLYPTTPGVNKAFTFERVFNYRTMSYKPAIVIQKIPRNSASNATPEQAFAAQISAMLDGDYDWWLSNWDAAAQKFHKERDAQMNRSPADWRGIWARAMRDQDVVMTERVVTGPLGPYVMLVYEMRDKAGKQTYKSSFVSKEEAGRWVATLDLSEDPFFHYYDQGKDRVSVTER